MADHTENAWWSLLGEYAISHEHLRELIEQFEADFSPGDGGYRQLGGLTDPVQRAVVSDQICLAASAIRANLVEARLHQRQFEAIVGDDGARYPTAETLKETLRQGAEMDMAITGCTRAMVSALDCLGAVGIGVLRMPKSITRGSFTDIDPETAPKSPATASPKQQKLWADLRTLCENHRKQRPDGWLDWLFGMRNLNVHRARQSRIRLQRMRDTDSPQLLVATSEPEQMAKETARFDLHLRNRPDLPDMHDFITSPMTNDLWINERATTTLPGIFEVVNALVEEASQFLASCWRYAGKWPAEFPLPVARWKLQDPPWPSFDGIAPNARRFPVDYGRAGPQMSKRLELAEQLRQQKS
jgi:hypothetical protein